MVLQNVNNGGWGGGGGGVVGVGNLKGGEALMGVGCGRSKIIFFE